ncbi:MAG: type IV pilus twitching motility protein PilT [Verrucomicrobiales bacterium]
MSDIVDLLTATRNAAGSDLHLAVGAPPAARVDGVLKPLLDTDLAPEDTKALIYGTLTDAQRARFEQQWDIDFAVHVNGVGRFRGNAHMVRGAIEAAFRFIPEEVPGLLSLGHGEAVLDLSDSRAGLLLVTGPTGSGKTTTLAAMAERILSNRSCVLVSIEDPIEYIFTHRYGIAKQRQVGDDAKSFSSALRAALRQDPDVILVSEMRDPETIATALTAAETGHLVISTLHSVDATKAIDRLVDAFPGDQQGQIRSQVAGVLVGIIAQRLIVRSDAPGRVLASEVMKANSAVRAVIREGRAEQLPGLIQIGASEGMHTMDDSLAHLLCHGHIAFDEALSNARDPAYVAARFKDHAQSQSKK